MTQHGNINDFIDDLHRNPIVVTVTGHTNAGKTSVVRSLTRDAQFGEVSPVPGSTKGIEGKRIHFYHKTALQVFDTPGFESASDVVGSLATDFDAVTVDSFFEGNGSHFAIEKAVWKQARSSCLILHVVDVSLPCQPKYRDELTLLTRSMVPVIPLLNFVQSGDNFREQWEELFRKCNQHIFVDYDAFLVKPLNEHKLLDRMIVLCHAPLHQQFLRHWNDSKTQRRRVQWNDSVALLADLLVNAAALRITQENVPPSDRVAAETEIKAKVKAAARGYEYDIHRRIVELYGHPKDIIDDPERHDGIKCDDANQWFGTSVKPYVAGGAVIGAVIGIGIDLALGGLTGGLGTIVGTAAGGLIGGAAVAAIINVAYDAKNKVVSGEIDERLLRTLATRGLILCREARYLGYGAVGLQIKLSGELPITEADQKSVDDSLRKVREHVRSQDIPLREEAITSALVSLRTQLEEQLKAMLRAITSGNE